MKTVFTSLVLALLINSGAFAHSPSTGIAKPNSTLEIQLAQQVTYPAAMLASTRGGTVVVQFQLDAMNQVMGVKVHTDNEQLNAELVKQLTGMKVNRAGQQAEQTYTVRLRFQPMD